MHKTPIRWLIVSLAVVILTGAFLLSRHSAEADSLTPSTSWPWKDAVKETTHPGVTYWRATSDDNTVLRLLDFDFATNPNLRLELFDQDQDDETPFDNNAGVWARGVAQVTCQLNAEGKGQVVAAWNGLFFATGAAAHHVAPIVLDGKVLYNVGKVRWTVGVQYQEGKPVFKVMLQPGRPDLAKEFTYAASGAQCLIKEGQPLKVQPLPPINSPKLRQPVPCLPEEVGHIPVVDHIKTSRTSMAWSQGNQHFYLLTVQEPDDESSSIGALRSPRKGDGGWTVADLQRFWQSFGAWGAVNIDGGVVTQMTCLLKDGNYLLIPPAWVTDKKNFLFPPEFTDAPQGGTLMYFYVRDTSK